MATKLELKTLLSSLNTLGLDLPYALISLTQVVQPDIDDRYRIPFLQTMFSDLPAILESTSEIDLVQLINDPPQEAVALRLLLDLRQVAQILMKLSYMQVVALAQHVPPGVPENQLNHLLKLQEHFQGWSLASLRNCVETISRTPLHLERQTVIKLEPTIPQDILHLVIQIIKISKEEAESFKLWIDSCSQNQLILLVNLLQMEFHSLIEIKRKLSTENEKQPKTGEKRPRSPENDIEQNIRKTSKFSSYSDDRQISIPLNNLFENNSNILEPPQNEDIFDYFFNSEDQPNNFNPSLTSSWHQVGIPTIPEIPTDKLSNNTPNTITSPPNILINTPTTKPTNTTPLNTFSSPNHVISSPTNVYSPPVSSPKSPTEEKSRKDIPTYNVTPVEPSNIPIPINNPLNPQLNSLYHLRVSMQPPAQTVYQRILKPFPAVMLIGPPDNEPHDFFVEASLVRIDTNSELPMCLDGNRVSNIAPGHLASFKRLKILSTTQQQGTLFKLKFQLKRYQKGTFVTIHGVQTVSNPIEVFSHTYYLQNRGRGRNLPAPPPTVTEVLPPNGPSSGCTRVVVLGTNFVESENLLVKFGDQIIRPQFHENKTLICTTLPGPSKTTVEVRVSNDGEDFCDTLATFTYD